MVPMRARGRVVGLLCLADPEPREFSAEAVESALVLAALTAAALETQRLVHDLRRALAEQGAGQADRVEGEKARALAAFAAGLTRELNSVFAVLLGKSQLLLARAQNDPLREGLAALEDAAWRGTDVVRRLLGLAEADQRGPVPADLAAIAQEALAYARARVQKEPDSRGRIEMVAELAPTPAVEGSATALREAVINLVLNAIEAMPAGGTVTVRTRGHDDGAELVIADTGEGIAAEARPRIFDPFFTTRPGHLGLGLCVVETVVLRAGGRLDVESGAGGTTVSVWLPVAGARGETPGPDGDAAEAAVAAPTGAPRPAACTGSILVVEEEEGIRTAVLDALMAVGHRVEAAVDATAALDRLGRGGVDVIVTDLALRDRSGLQLAAAVRQRSPRTAVVLLTGWGRRLHEDRVRESGVDVMLVKPVQADRVRAAVAEALRLRPPA
jgi:signal transduction histidine kinase/CheY-like chemotaxis protein